ncbi:acyltransferase [Pseudomonas sp. J452]|uniref:acyltransferase family protein n=1 Tax=Pseudomonas sp. J452 TaxID=2898441 RepID=UPI0021ADE26B|nr:acyltransferase family protein [Pseudomonas sp. J452]UUY06993.1 acyltransferase [Pseudomonas sp. J452]
MTAQLNVGLSPEQLHASQQYRADIEGLRAIAVLAVVAFHAFPFWLPGGFAGVDVFFVISGFLIGSIIISKLDDQSFSFIDFYSRRIKRIFPALALVMSFSLVCGWFVLLPNEYKQLGKHIAAGSGFAANWALWSESGYFDTAADLKPMLHLWSLGIEEQFYLAWPLILWAAWKLRLNLLTITLGLTAASFCLNIDMIRKDEVATFYLPFTRAWELMAGSLLAWICIYKHTELQRFICNLAMAGGDPAHHGAAATAASALGLLMIGLPFLVLDKNSEFPGWTASFSVAGTILVIAAGQSSWINRVLLGSKIAVFFGLISFPLYLWHWPLLAFARIMEDGNASREIRAAAVVSSIILAYATMKLIENNLRFRKHWSVPVSLLLIMALIGAAGAYIYTNGGIPSRTTEFNQRLDQFKGTAPEFVVSKQCLEKHPLAKSCMESPDRKTDVMIIGDSHARRLFPGLASIYEKQGRGILALGGSGCPPFIDIESGQRSSQPRCAPLMKHAFDLALQAEIKTVFLASRGPMYLTGSGFGSTPDADWKFVLTKPSNKELRDPKKLFEIGMRDTVALLTKAGKKVVFVIDNPELGFHPMECLDLTRPVRMTEAKVIRPCAIERSSFDARVKDYLAIVHSVLKEFPQVKVLDLPKAFCDENYCYAEHDGKMIYQDGDHLSVYGSHLAAAAFVKQFRKTVVAQ